MRKFKIAILQETKSNLLVNASFEKNVSNNNSTEENKSHLEYFWTYYVIVASNYNSLGDG